MEENKLTMYDRITKVLIDKGLVKRNGQVNFTKAEKLANITTSTLSKLKSRATSKGELGEPNIQKFLSTFNVREDWLRHGKGEMYEKEQEKVVKENSTPSLPIEEYRAWINDERVNSAHLRELNLRFVNIIENLSAKVGINNNA